MAAKNICQTLIKGLIAIAFSFSVSHAETIVIDGVTSDWTTDDRLELSATVDGYEISGRYEDNTYKVLLVNSDGTIGENTTLWLNTDQDSSTGYLIWDYAGGAEYNVNIASDGQPYLYSDSAGETLVSGPLEHNIVTVGAETTMEIAIPEALIATPADGFNMLIDINNAKFLPLSYWPAGNNYILLKESVELVTSDTISTDWSAEDRLELGATVDGYEISGRYENSTYKVLLTNTSGTIGTNTTLWLNTDQDSTTGYLIWGYAGGAEYNVNIESDGQPYLYSDSAGETLVSGPLAHSIVTEGTATSIEIEIPEGLIGTPTTRGINMLIDVNNSNFLPASYWPATNNYIIQKESDTITTDWSTQDRLELGATVDGYEISGRYEDSTYKLLLTNTSGTVGKNTTFWLNTDQDSTTGYLIWGYAGGAEYNINIASDGQPYLYSGSAAEMLVSGPLTHNIVTEGTATSIEIEIPEGLIDTPTTEGINMLIDVNDTNFLPASYWPATNNYIILKETVYSNSGIQIDGAKADWNSDDRLDLDTSVAISTAELYGRYENGSYKFLLHDTLRTIGENTTFWLNTDQDASTGYQVLGNAGGAEFNVNLNSSGVPYLYSGSVGQTLVAGPLEYVTLADDDTGSITEFSIPASSVGSPSGDGINVLVDVNDSSYMPTSYSPDTNVYTVLHEVEPAPIAIIFSETSQSQFFDSKAYAQLFMSVQSQAIMAGLPFDLLHEDDLLDLYKVTQYKTLVFPYFGNVKSEYLAAIEQNLTAAVTEHNVGIVTASNWMTNDETGESLSGNAYSRMQALLGLGRVDGGGPYTIDYSISNNTHSVTSGIFDTNEVLKSYTSSYTDYFEVTGSYESSVLATQNIDGVGTLNSLIVTENGGRHAHFATVQQMTDPNLLWSVLQWSVYGEKAPASLNMTRHDSLFVARNDMDQSMFSDEVEDVNGNLLTILQTWKEDYNFVGSYYINIGNDSDNSEETDWSYSGPLYQSYMDMGNEMGTHSYTHPHNTNTLTSEEIEFQFATSRSEIENNLDITDLSGAVPGAPEDLATALDIIQHLDYLSGGYSGSGAGYPNASGFLNPTISQVYMSPNMSFDFTLVEFYNLTAEAAKQVWFDEFDELVNNTPQGLVHWPWHDYGPSDPDNAGYTVAMFSDLISRAADAGSEFITGKDYSERIKAFKNAELSVTKSGTAVTAVTSAVDAGKFALRVADGTTIQSVENWYAYDDNQVFLASNSGGTYTIQLGTAANDVSRISGLPARGELVSLTGDGTDLEFTFNGEGTVTVDLKCTPSALTVSGGSSSFTYTDSDTIGIVFTTDAVHASTKVDATCN